MSKLWELEMVREAWRAAIHGFAKSRTWLSDWTELSALNPSEIDILCLYTTLSLKAISEIIRFLENSRNSH